MKEFRFDNVRGWATKIDPIGQFQHEALGTDVLFFSESEMRYRSLVIPYKNLEQPKLRVDRLFFRNWIYFDCVYEDAQYTFLLRTKLKELQKIPLAFTVSINRRIFINLVVAVIGVQVCLGLSELIINWLHK